MHPAVGFSIKPLKTRFGHLAVFPATGTPGPKQTHITPDVGLTCCEESFADVTALQQ